MFARLATPAMLFALASSLLAASSEALSLHQVLRRAHEPRGPVHSLLEKAASAPIATHRVLCSSTARTARKMSHPHSQHAACSDALAIDIA